MNHFKLVIKTLLINVDLIRILSETALDSVSAQPFQIIMCWNFCNALLKFVMRQRDFRWSQPKVDFGKKFLGLAKFGFHPCIFIIDLIFTRWLQIFRTGHTLIKIDSFIRINRLENHLSKIIIRLQIFDFWQGDLRNLQSFCNPIRIKQKFARKLRSLAQIQFCTVWLQLFKKLRRACNLDRLGRNNHRHPVKTIFYVITRLRVVVRIKAVFRQFVWWNFH